MKNQVYKEGRTMVVTASAAISSGDLVKVGSLVGVAATDIAEDAEGTVVFEGVYSCPKESEAISQGEAVYYKASTGKLTTTSTGNTFAGYAWSDALLADANIDVRLLF